MTLPHTTNKQQEILSLISRFRFLNTIQIQKFLHHKNKKTIHDWLKDLHNNKYLGKIYDDTTFEGRRIPTVFYIDTNGIAFLKAQNSFIPSFIKNLYRENEKSEFFVEQSQLLGDIALTLLEDKKEKTDHIITPGDYTNPSSPFYFLTEEINPSLCFIKKKTNKWYLVEIFEPTIKTYSIRKKLRTYIQFFFSNSWENHTKESFPILLFICSTDVVFSYAKRFAKKVIKENQNPEDLHMCFAKFDQVKKFGVTGEIWEETK